MHLSLDKNAEAEAALRKHVALLPKDSDAFYSLGLALRSQARYLVITPSFYSLGLALRSQERAEPGPSPSPNPNP